MVQNKSTTGSWFFENRGEGKIPPEESLPGLALPLGVNPSQCGGFSALRSDTTGT